jgi:hypothetical protein
MDRSRGGGRWWAGRAATTGPGSPRKPGSVAWAAPLRPSSISLKIAQRGFGVGPTRSRSAPPGEQVEVDLILGRGTKLGTARRRPGAPAPTPSAHSGHPWPPISSQWTTLRTRRTVRTDLWATVVARSSPSERVPTGSARAGPQSRLKARLAGLGCACRGESGPAVVAPSGIRCRAHRCPHGCRAGADGGRWEPWGDPGSVARRRRKQKRDVANPQ